MEKEDSPPPKGINRGSDPLDASSGKAIESGLREALKKLEHRVEVLTSISRQQQSFGNYEVAEAYWKQVTESRASVQTIHKLLNIGKRGGDLKWPRKKQEPIPDFLPHRKDKY